MRQGRAPVDRARPSRPEIGPGPGPEGGPERVHDLRSAPSRYDRPMKNLTWIPLAAALLVAPLQAQGSDEQAELRAKYEEKIAKDFVSYGAWQLDYDAVRAKAAEEGKLIFAYFSRSYSP